MVSLKGEIVAAGGIILESGTFGGDGRINRRDRVLLVHRPRYDDWGFPKGKAEPGETVEETALREVREETGLACKIIGPISENRYLSQKGGEARPKVVHYFMMVRTGGEITTDGFEIDQARWVPPAEAIELLSYDFDRNMLDDLTD